MEGPPEETAKEEGPCSCCPYGFHIDTGFVKFAEEQLSFPQRTNDADKIVKTIHAPKATKLWCSQRQSINSMVMVKNGQHPPLENSGNSTKFNRKPVKRGSALIQQKILDLHQSCAPPKSNEEIYGTGLLDAIKEFEDFVRKTWGRRRRSRSRACTVSLFDPATQQKEGGNQSKGHDVCRHCQRKCACKQAETVEQLNDQKEKSQNCPTPPDSNTIGVNTELVSTHTTTGTNTVMPPEPTHAACRTGRLSKLTIRTQKLPTTHPPDCGGDSGGLKDEIMKLEQPEVTSSTEEFADESVTITDQLDLDHTPKNPSPDMASALKLVNEALVRGRTGRDVVTALSVIQEEWFGVVEKKDAYASDIANYLSTFENHSAQLLRYMVNIPDVHGITALHYAVSYGNFMTVSKLLDTNVADPNKPNKAGYTSIMLASLAEIKTAQQEQTAKRLISLGDVNIKAAQHGQTALMLSASHGRSKMVKLLLQGGAEVNAQDEDGSTALMCAVEHGHADIVQCLLAKPSCDPSLTDVDGLTALNVAMDAGHKDIAVMLYAHMHFGKSREPPSKTPIADSLVSSKRSRSTTNVSPARPSNDGKRSSSGNADLQSVARKQRSSIN